MIFHMNTSMRSKKHTHPPCLRTVAMLATFLVAVIHAPSAAGQPSDGEGSERAEDPATPVTAAGVKSLLRRPRGSVSLGGPSSGRLLNPVELPDEGRGYAIIKGMRSRQTNFGTRELIGGLERAFARVRRLHRGSVAAVGNLGSETGGKIRWSVSHQAGRDADIALYATDLKGRQVHPGRMLYFGEDGRSRNGRYRFDTRRNLAFAVALLEDTEVAVQYLFVSEWLKTMMLDEGAKIGLSEELLARLAVVLHQPSDSNPHADHYHLRLYCTIEDRIQGCLNRGPTRPWVDAGDAEMDANVDALVAALSISSTRLQGQVVDRLGALRAARALPALLATLSDPSKKVRAKALRAVSGLQTLDSLPGLLSAMRETEDPAWARKLFAAVLKMNHADTAPLAMGFLGSPEDFVAARVVKRALPDLQHTAARILGRFGRKDAVSALIPLLGSSKKAVRMAAHDALLRSTNQRVDGRALKSSSARRRSKTLKRWRGFLAKHKADTWLQWMRLGFEARGIRFRGKMASRAGVETLIKHIRHRDDIVGDNAIRVLSVLTEHYVDPRWRNPRNNQRHWRHWWAANQDTCPLE